MPKFTLTAEHTDFQGNPDGTKVYYEFYVNYLGDILEHVDLFIKGCGYVPTGILDYVVDEPVDNVNHSEFYFDTERNK